MSAMRISTKGRYAVRVMLDLALYGRKEYVKARQIAERQGISEKYLEQILALMKKQNVVVAVRGANGGYKLKNPPQSTTVGQVLRAVEDNLEIVDCLHKSCSAKCNCVSRNLWAKLYDNINSYLDTISLKQLSEDNL